MLPTIPLLALAHLALAASSRLLPDPSLTIQPRSSPALPFSLTYLFSAHLSLGALFPPIPVPGGLQLISPILSGTVSGPAINATITAGLALPALYNNQTLQVPVIDLYGHTSDGVSFSIHEVGIGTPSGQVSRIELTIGGGAKYAALRDGYILGVINPSPDGGHVAVEGYLVGNTAQYA